MWALFMNDMRSAKIEFHEPICWADTRQELIDLLVTERVEAYRDGQWGKSYRKGGPLEWKNALEAPNFEGWGFRGLVPFHDAPPDWLPHIHTLSSLEAAQ